MMMRGDLDMNGAMCTECLARVAVPFDNRLRGPSFAKLYITSLISPHQSRSENEMLSSIKISQ